MTAAFVRWAVFLSLEFEYFVLFEASRFKVHVSFPGQEPQEVHCSPSHFRPLALVLGTLGERCKVRLASS